MCQAHCWVFDMISLYAPHSPLRKAYYCPILQLRKNEAERSRSLSEVTQVARRQTPVSRALCGAETVACAAALSHFSLDLSFSIYEMGLITQPCFLHGAERGPRKHWMSPPFLFPLRIDAELGHATAGCGGV